MHIFSDYSQISERCVEIAHNCTQQNIVIKPSNHSFKKEILPISSHSISHCCLHKELTRRSRL
jgi:hypothetical protein